ncbi:MAG TPA: L-sorbosone dehydrogenase [Pirellulaceae bacterium]|jgi:hypothetical protein|nr:L-sorbosone dehydrogenase [Pirellulaceae bacterium]
MMTRRLKFVRNLLSIAALGAGALTAAAAPFDDATPAESIRVPEGFKVERIYVVPGESQGSWVSMTVDPKGRLIASDQAGGLYRITVPEEEGAQASVEKISDRVGHAQGLLCAFDSLYVMSQPPNSQGESLLYRLTDADGDDRFEGADVVLKTRGTPGEHGPHALVLGPDGNSIFLCAGNHTAVPPLSRSYVPQVWQEDQLLPRMWDARGHAVGILAPGGWICRLNPDGTDVTLVSVGYRNSYDFAFNDAGDIFTYDSDMEWDIGTPWYRPTRICFAMNGSDYGWRSGSGKFPAIYPDTLPAVADVGPGSPTGVAYGSGAKFPAKYQRSLFAADWSYGTIYSMELQADGAGYVATHDIFCSASPLPVADMVIRPQDGALYFVIGGRETQSAIYRIRYVGEESTEPIQAEVATNPAAELRREFEAALLDPTAEVVEKALAELDSEDRFLQYAARTLIEAAPKPLWIEKIGQLSPVARIQAWIAIARAWNGGAAQRAQVAARGVAWLSTIDWTSLSQGQQVDLLRAYGLIFARLGAPDEDSRQAVLDQIASSYPADDRLANHELCRLLVYLNAPNVADKTLDLMERTASQEEQMHYAYCLRALTQGWTPQTRERYFTWFNDAAALRGGMSFEGFLGNIKQEAVDRLPADARNSLRPILNAKIASSEPTLVPQNREKVQTWTTDALVAAIENAGGERNLERGREIYAEASCFKCHRFESVGGVVGPDLTAAGGRFSVRDLVEAIVDPDKVISDQYATQQFVLDDGRVVSGRVVNLKGEALRVLTNPLDPSSIVNVDRGSVEQSLPGKTSMMPSGLADYFTVEELADLVAFVRSGAVKTIAKK